MSASGRYVILTTTDTSGNGRLLSAYGFLNAVSHTVRTLGFYSKLSNSHVRDLDAFVDD